MSMPNDYGARVIKLDVGSAEANAAAARAEAAAEAVEAVVATNDGIMAAAIRDPESETKAELNAAFVGVVATGVITRDSAGRISTAVEDGVTHTYTRDAEGRVSRDATDSRIVSYTRDAEGRVSGWTTEELA